MMNRMSECVQRQEELLDTAALLPTTQKFVLNYVSVQDMGTWARSIRKLRRVGKLDK